MPTCFNQIVSHLILCIKNGTIAEFRIIHLSAAGSEFREPKKDR